MKRLVKFWATAIFAGWCAAAFAQTADEVVEKHLEAMGGRDALSKIQSRFSAGTMKVSTQGMEFSGPIEVYNKQPNLLRVYVKLDLSSAGAGEAVVDTRFDGKVGFTSHSMQGDREITGKQLDALRENHFPTPLLKYKESGATVELLGKDKLGEQDVLVLRYFPKSGSPAKWYVDASNYLVTRVQMNTEAPELGGEIEQTSEMSDYRSVEGVKVPFLTRVTNKFQVITITLENVEHNRPIDDAMFAKPAPKPSATP
jgi:outer membrane lipoprotein-sorting protein